MSSRAGSVGVFRTDQSLVVQSWDAWMVESTGVSESVACGSPLTSLFPELERRGVLSRLRRVAEGNGVDVLAPALHKYLIPCAPRDKTSRFERMRQHVTLAPLRSLGGVSGVIVTIEDVTERFDREKRLAADLDSQDEAVRLRAARTLAADNESPALLADALADESWRVRRVASEGMARGGGREVVDTLLQILRDHHRDPALLNSAITALAQTHEDVVMAIVALLDFDEADVRTYAALSLGLLADSRAVAPLITRLDDGDMNVRYHAIEALGRIGDRAAAEPLAAVAETRDFFLAFAALDALALIGDPSVAPRLMPLLEDPFLLPAAAACIGALGAEDVAVPLASLTRAPDAPIALIALALADVYDRIDAEFGEGQLVADLAGAVMTLASQRALVAAIPAASLEERRAMILVLSWMNFDGVDPFLASLLADDDLRNIVAECLSRRGVDAAPFIEAAARDADDEIKGAAALALARIGSETSVPILIEWLAASPPVVIAAAGALGAIGDRRAFAPLLAVMDHPEAAVRQAAVSGLNSIGHPAMEEVIIERLGSESARIRESATRVAGYFGYRRCLDRMIALCHDPDEMVRRAAVEYLANYDERPAWKAIRESSVNDASPTVRAAAARALGQSSSLETLHALVAVSEDQNLWVRYYAARALARRGDRHADVVACLAERATRDGAVPVRIAAIEALGTLAAQSMTDVVISLSRELESEVACAAITALGAFDTAATAPALMQALESEEPVRMHAALDALGRQGADHAVEAIRTLVRRTRDADLREHGIRALGAMRTEAATAAILSLATDRRLRSMIVDALANLGEHQVVWLQRELGRESDAARAIIVEALGRMKHGGATRALAAALDDAVPSIRLAAARALGRLDVRDARSQLATLARTDENPAVRLAAQDALARG